MIDLAALQRDAIADWLDDRAHLLSKIAPYEALELWIVADAVRNCEMLPGGIIAGACQPFPTNGGTAIG